MNLRSFSRRVHSRVMIFTLVALSMVLPATAHVLCIRRNAAVLDGKRCEVNYRSYGDLDGDGRVETVFSVAWQGPYGCNQRLVLAKPNSRGWRVLATDDWSGGDHLRGDVTDVNGDGRAEIVARAVSGDGHGVCSILALRKGKLVDLHNTDDFETRFWNTKLRDLDGDGIPEVLSVGPISFMFVGDHWLTIFKWNGSGYTEVSRRFPREYDRVIKDLKQVRHDLQFTKSYGTKSTPQSNPQLFSDIYYYLGRAYEYRNRRQDARQDYAIACRLDPTDERRTNAFRRTWKGRRHDDQDKSNIYQPID